LEIASLITLFFEDNTEIRQKWRYSENSFYCIKHGGFVCSLGSVLTILVMQSKQWEPKR